MRFEKRKEILYERLGHEILALDTRRNMPYVFNPVAAFIFSLINQNLSPEEIANRLCTDYEVNFREALDDVHIIVNDFLEKGILIASHPLY